MSTSQLCTSRTPPERKLIASDGRTRLYKFRHFYATMDYLRHTLNNYINGNGDLIDDELVQPLNFQCYDIEQDIVVSYGGRSLVNNLIYLFHHWSYHPIHTRDVDITQKINTLDLRICYWKQVSNHLQCILSGLNTGGKQLIS